MKTFIYLICSLWLSFAVHAVELKFEPATPIVEINKTTVLSVQGAVGKVEWTASKGKIQGEGNQVTYVAPEQAGFVVVTALDSEGNFATVKVVITPPNDFSLENAQWEIFTNRSYIHALLLSEDGKTLWVGTDGGLEKRDTQTGEIRQVFINTNGLPDNQVLSLLSDSQGGLWVGTYNGGLAHYAQGQWQVFNTDNSGLPSNDVFSLLSDSQGGLWVGTYGGLAHYAQGQWQVFNTDNSGLPDNHISAFLPDSQGGLWIGTMGGGLAHYAQGQWQVFNTDNSGLPSNYVEAILPDSQGGMWVGTMRGLAHYAQGQWQVFNTDNSGLPYKWVTVLLLDSQGGLWAGTWKGGLAHYAQGQWQVFNTYNSGLPDSWVWSLHPDSQGGLWVGTYRGGLAHYAQGQWQVFNTDNSGLPHNNVATLLPDSQGGGLWVGTMGGGLAHHARGQWQVFNTDNSGLPDNRVKVLLPDSQDGLWVGTYGGGLTHYAQGQWQVFNTDNSGLPDNRVKVLLPDSQDGLWVGTYGGGLTHYAQGKWQVFNTDNSGLPHNNVAALLLDSQGGLWVGTWGGGLAHYAQEQWQVFNKDNSGLPSNWVNTLLPDSQGDLWVGTDGGLAHYMQGKWQVFNTDNSGLPHNWVTANLLPDSQGGLWVGTGRGGLAHLTFGRKNELCTQTEIDGATCQAIQQGQHAAIIVAAGGAQNTNTLWESTEAITTHLYRTFYRRGFDKSNIYYLSSKTWADFDGDGFNDRINRISEDRYLTLDDLKKAIEWAKGLGKLDQPFYFFFMDHGGEGKLHLAPNLQISAEEIKPLLDDYQNTTGNQLIVVIEACHSGSLIPALTAPNRAVITSAKAEEKAYFFEKKGFSRFFADYLLKGTSFSEAFQLATRDQDKLRGKNLQFQTAGGTGMTPQTPQLDDNNDGKYDPTQDNNWLKTVYINGKFTTADDTLAIENLTPAATLSVGQTVQLQAKATVAQGTVKRVWAVIHPPKLAQVIDTSGTPILAFPRVNLVQSTELSDTWQTTWNDAIYNGNYTLTFYAEDNEKNIASSEQDTVLTVSGGIEPPAKAQVQIHLDKTRYQRGEAFKATLTEDLGWGYDLYAAVVMPDGNYFTLKNTNELRAVKEAKPWYAQRKQSQSVTLLDLTLPTDLPMGQYCLYGILSPEQNDVFEAMNQNLWVYGQQCFELF